ncbi:PspA/IM30 family protein [Motiliproteus sediminis]|uniref:PspA/IM30 family protein n=1 Tax=Motiliproteus sediminis TaxID=1468178 RepID=UPI001AEFEE29|nr:PspA/IM30 family protein [Motiliproteus sediminis]
MSMQLVRKIGTLLRGGARETLEGVVDGNALRILEQEVIDYEQALLGAKRQLTQLVAERMRVERELGLLQQRQFEREAQLAEALSAGRDSEVEPLADRIADYEREILSQRKMRDALAVEEQRRSESLRVSVRELDGYRRELRLFKSRQRDALIQGRTAAGQGELQSARSALQLSLGRIRQRGDEQDFQEQAEEALERQLQQDPLTQVDKASEDRQREQRRAAIIARLREEGPVRPA